MNNELELRISTNVEQANAKLDKLINTLNNGTKATNNLTKSASNISKAFNFTSIYIIARRFFNLFLDGIDSINKYTETLNMFHLVMGDLTAQADKFQNTMANAFGNDTQKQLEYQSYFQTLTESMGLQEKYAYIISENMTKMTYDISSLFDKEQDDVASALRSGLVGQTKPVRNFGMDITENSLQPILDRLGIDRTVRELSQVEKEIVRYLALLQQSSIAHGDMANTIESPSNQLRVFKNQLIECQRWFSALFINTFAKAMPYINAVVMVIKEICVWLGTLFGIEISDYNSGVASSYVDDMEDYGDAVDDATSKVKELKRQTLGFDQINNINENNNNSSGSGGTNVSGGIDQRLLDAIKGYDNGMEKIRMKAMDIRNAILDWLGFLLDGDEIVGYSLPKALRNVWKWWNKLNTEGKVLVALGLGVVISGIIKKLKSLVTILGSSGLLKVVTGLLNPIKNLVYAISSDGLAKGIQLWSGTLTAMESLTIALLGTGGLVTGFYLASDAGKEFNEIGEITSGVVLKLGGSLLSTATSGALMGASIGGVHGAIVGGILGAMATLIGYLSGLNSETSTYIDNLIDESREQYEVNQAILENRDILYEKVLATSEEHEANKRLVETLKELTDENGKVQSGYETRVAYILNELNNAYGTEYKLIDGQITKNGEAIDSMEEVCTTIDKIIEKKRAEAVLDGLKDNYTKALQNEKQYYTEYAKALEKNKKAQEEYNKVYEEYYQNYIDKGASSDQARMNAINQIRIEHFKLSEAVQSTGDNVVKAEERWKSSLTDISMYENLLSATTEENSEKINQALERISNSYKSNGLTIQMSLSETLRYAIDYNNQMKQNFEETGDEITTQQYENSQKSLNNLIESLTNQTKTVEDLTPEIVDAWGVLSEESHDKFKANIEKLPNTIRKTLLGKMKNAGYDIGKDLDSGLNKSKTEIDKTSENTGKDIVKKTESGAEKETKKKGIFNGFFNGTKNALNSLFNSVNFISLGNNVFNGILKGMNNLNVPSMFSSFSNSLVKNLAKSLGIHSPAKKTIPIGSFTFLGIKEGMDEEIPSIQKTALKMVDTLQTTFDKSMYDLSLESAIMPDLNQNISNVSTYKTDVSLDYNMLEQASYNGFARAIQRYGLVKIDVKQDKGSIVETAIEGINDITKQTGENPIDLW